MYGVVLWSDSQEQKAVIWCEDHGDLAYYRQQERDTAIVMDAGDWVQFEVTVHRDMRIAHNPKLILDGVLPDLAHALAEVGSPAAPSETDEEDAPHSSADIIPFSRTGRMNGPRSVRDGTGKRMLA